MAASTGVTTMPGLSGTRKLSLHRRFLRVRDVEGAEGGPKDRSAARSRPTPHPLQGERAAPGRRDALRRAL